LESTEGQLRAGQYIFAGAVMQRPRLLEFIVEHSDLAAIGLVTDMVPLLGENRTVARLGMRLNTLLGTSIPEPSFRPGLDSLYGALRIDRSDWSGRDFGWKIGPVLNAAGRMGETELALDLLCSNDEEGSSSLARKLVRLNEKRKERTRIIKPLSMNYSVENRSGSRPLCSSASMNASSPAFPVS
jgi:single-stranded-DNA-specific exonuclease